MKILVKLYFTGIVLVPLLSVAQLAENFSDGNFTSNPTWIANQANWKINPDLQLQSNDTIANNTFYLSTVSTLVNQAQWEIFVNLRFNTSSANYVDIFLTASDSNLLSPNTYGYFVRIGNTDDEISLYRKSPTGVITKIIDGRNGITANSNNRLKIKVLRNASYKWILLTDPTGTGNSYVTEGMVSDSTYLTSVYFGIAITQSTKTFFQQHFFDDILVQPYLSDTIAPQLISASAVSSTQLDILFTEPLEKTQGEAIHHYSVNHPTAAPISAVLDPTNHALVHLTFNNEFKSGFTYQVTVNNLKDLEDNTFENGIADFVFLAPFTPRMYDILIDEIFADHTPPVGLPLHEWIELTNVSSLPINVKGWILQDANGSSGAFPDCIIKPDSFLIVCSSVANSTLLPFGKVISVSNFPSLDNSGELLILRSPTGSIIHTVNFTTEWYRDETKSKGGWSLEMIDTRNPCHGINNWKASTHIIGGTPGIKNTVSAVNPDHKPPGVLNAFATDSFHILLLFDETLDSTNAVQPANFTISEGMGNPISSSFISPWFDRITLQTYYPLIPGKTYTITIKNLTDCSGNGIGAKNTIRVGLGEAPLPADIIINEVLFNPPPNGTDYVEIYNRSNKIIDLRECYIANRNSAGDISNPSQLNGYTTLLFPYDFIVITQKAALVKSTFITPNPDAFNEPGNMPPFNNDKGNVVILKATGEIIDELAYNENWHFALLQNKKGVSLERMNYHSPTQSAANWHSASTSSGYGTPGYKNSQVNIQNGVKGEIHISPEIISPDNDGQDDYAAIDYIFPEPGSVVNITIFDAMGRPVKFLQRNALCGTRGNFRWNGMGENNQALPAGVYIFMTEVFSVKGYQKQFKNTIVLARRY